MRLLGETVDVNKLPLCYCRNDVCCVCVNTEGGSTLAHGPDAGSAEQSDTASTEQCVGDKTKPELDCLSDAMKAELEDTEMKKHTVVTATVAESDAISPPPSESCNPAANVVKQDGSQVKSEDPLVKEEEDAVENDDQNADGKQSTLYWNYHWPKVSSDLCMMRVKHKNFSYHKRSIC